MTNIIFRIWLYLFYRPLFSCVLSLLYPMVIVMFLKMLCTPSITECVHEPDAAPLESGLLIGLQLGLNPPVPIPVVPAPPIPIPVPVDLSHHPSLVPIPVKSGGFIGFEVGFNHARYAQANAVLPIYFAYPDLFPEIDPDPDLLPSTAPSRPVMLDPLPRPATSSPSVQPYVPAPAITIFTTNLIPDAMPIPAASSPCVKPYTPSIIAASTPNLTFDPFQLTPATSSPALSPCNKTPVTVPTVDPTPVVTPVDLNALTEAFFTRKNYHNFVQNFVSQKFTLKPDGINVREILTNLGYVRNNMPLHFLSNSDMDSLNPKAPINVAIESTHFLLNKKSSKTDIMKILHLRASIATVNALHLLNDDSDNPDIINKTYTAYLKAEMKQMGVK